MARKKQSTTEQSAAVVKYEPNDREQAVIAKHKERVKNAPPPPKVKVSDGNCVKPDHPSLGHGYMLMMESFGTTSISFANQIQNQLINGLTVGREIDQEVVNFGLAVIASIKPRDELETMLAAQMAAIHCATMTFARRLNHVESIPQQDSAERTLNKLARTFTTQMEALKRYRRNDGEQKVVVQHVHVADGGQAIVGTVEQRNDRGEG